MGTTFGFRKGNEPFRILARLTEELGEIAAEVNHIERTGAKVLKRGEPDRKALAYEIEDLLHTALALAKYYGVESTVDQAARETRDRLLSVGAIKSA